MQKIKNADFKYESDTFSKPTLLAQIARASVPEQIWQAIDATQLKSLLEAFGFAVTFADSGSADALYLTHLGISHGIQLYTVSDEESETRVADLAIGFQIIFPEHSLDVHLCNVWNAMYTFGKCYLNSEDELVIQADMPVYGGVTSMAIARFAVEYLDLFDDLQRFVAHHI